MPELYIKRSGLNTYHIWKNSYFPIYIDDICNLIDMNQEECKTFMRDNFNIQISLGSNQRFLIYFINKYEAEKALEWIESLFLAHEFFKD